MNHLRENKKGFLTLELLLTITIFSMILIAFQDALVLSLRSQRKLEKITEQFQEKSMLIETIQRDFSYMIPLKDGKQLFFMDDSNYLLLRFISQKSIAYPPRQLKSRMLLVEYLFNKTKDKDALITRKVEEISGYNEYTLERELRDAFTSKYLLGGGLVNFKLEGKVNQSWYEKLKTFDMEWKKSLEKSEIDFYRFYFYPFRVKKVGNDESQ